MGCGRRLKIWETIVYGGVRQNEKTGWKNVFFYIFQKPEIFGKILLLQKRLIPRVSQLKFVSKIA